ncbi:MAG: GNAT family N-acetyltransferase [Prolixibacteraceae bacterium]|nr:GNAT family N-acetyltransferase [Burkholderiales bacterium]
MPDLTIDRARPADIPALANLLATLFAIEKDFTADADRQLRGLELLLREPEERAAIFVARGPDHAVIGMVSAQLVVSTAEGASSAWIEDVVVSAPHRGLGVARRLLEAALDWASRHGATRAQLLADRANLPARDFYRHLDWKATQLDAWRLFLRART